MLIEFNKPLDSPSRDTYFSLPPLITSGIQNPPKIGFS